MDWKKDLNKALRNIYAWDYRNDSESNLRDELTDNQFRQIESFIQSLLEEVIKNILENQDRASNLALGDCKEEKVFAVDVDDIKATALKWNIIIK